MRKKFYFVRHGESLWNVKRLCQGQTDIALSPKGKKDAEYFAKTLSTLSVKTIISSPLKRAQQTAQIIREKLSHTKLLFFEEFMERGWGKFEGISSQEMFAIEKKEETDPNFLIDPTVASIESMKNRLQIGLDKVFSEESPALVVSHGRLLRTLCDVLCLPKLQKVKNLCLIEFVQEGGSWQMQIL